MTAGADDAEPAETPRRRRGWQFGARPRVQTRARLNGDSSRYCRNGHFGSIRLEVSQDGEAGAFCFCIAHLLVAALYACHLEKMTAVMSGGHRATASPEESPLALRCGWVLLGAGIFMVRDADLPPFLR